MDDAILELCVQLDELALHILELSEEQVKCRVKLEEAMKPGFVHIAKSRYIMGNRTVCSLQLPTEDSAEFDALATVQCEEFKTDKEHRVYKLVDTSQKSSSETSDNTELRQRKEKIRSGDFERDELSSDEPDVDKPKTNSFNPLKWFGVLVPQNLRMAQNCFQTVLPLVVECANVQNDLQCAQLKYQRILKEKESLVES